MSTKYKAAAVFVIAAFVSFVLSVTLWFSGQKGTGIFVGLWVPSILALGAFAMTTLDIREGRHE
ncbi:MAG: hypothetical protein NVSMB25_26260 [Thermoleophilaceae bacterium]